MTQLLFKIEKAGRSLAPLANYVCWGCWSIVQVAEHVVLCWNGWSLIKMQFMGMLHLFQLVAGCCSCFYTYGKHQVSWPNGKSDFLQRCGRRFRKFEWFLRRMLVQCCLNLSSLVCGFPRFSTNSSLLFPPCNCLATYLAIYSLVSLTVPQLLFWTST